MKTILRKALRVILKFAYPTLYQIESGTTYLDHIQSLIYDSNISAKAKIYGKSIIKSSTINDYTYIAKNATLNKCSIGKFCSIGPNLMCGGGIHPVNGISTSPAFYSIRNQAGITFSDQNKIEEELPVEIGNDVFIGMNVTILDGVKIGDGAIIGAGAVVSKDIPPYAIAVGSPIRIIKYRFNQETIDKLLEIKWWDFDTNKLKDLEKYFFNIELFINKCTQDV